MNKTTVKIFNDKIIDKLLMYLIVYADGVLMTLTILISIFVFCFTYSGIIDSNVFLKIGFAGMCSIVCFVLCICVFANLFKWYLPDGEIPSKSQLWYMKKQETNESW